MYNYCSVDSSLYVDNNKIALDNYSVSVSVKDFKRNLYEYTLYNDRMVRNANGWLFIPYRQRDLKYFFSHIWDMTKI